MEVLVVVVVVSKKRTISIPQTWQEPQSLQSASSSCNVLFYFKHQYQFLHLRNKKILSFDFTQINHPKIWVTALSPKSLYTVFRAEAPSDNCLNRGFRWKIKECRKVQNAVSCTWKCFAENSAFLCFATLPQMLWVLNAPDFLLNTLLRTKRGEAKSLPQNIKGCENQNVFSLEDAKSLANSQSDLRNMEMVTLDLESRKLWIQNILNLSTFQISHPTVSDIPIACVTSVSPLLKGNFLEPVHNKNDHKTRR